MSWHSNELWYSFGSLRERTPPARPWEETDYRLADQMSNYWANFIKTGDPNGEGLPLWLESDDSYGFAKLGGEIVGCTCKRKLDEVILEFLESRHVLPV